MNRRGFTLIELIAAIAVIAMLCGGVVQLASMAADTARINETLAKLAIFKEAIIGNPRIITRESRTDFGYIGDVGALPGQLSDLWIRPSSMPMYSYNSTKQAGAGWAGPYIDVGPLEFVDDLTKDGWGNPISYVVGKGASSLTGQQYEAQLISYGPDAKVNTADDIKVEIYTTEIYSTITSFVRDSSNKPISGLNVTAIYPINGTLPAIMPVSATALTDGFGGYAIPNVPMGNRSVSIFPTLAYNDGTALATGGAYESFQFNILSFTCGSITSARIDYNDVDLMGVPAYYTVLKIGGKTPFNNVKPLPGSGTPLTFGTPVDVSANTCSGNASGVTLIYPARVQSAYSLLPDQLLTSIASAGTGYQVNYQTFQTSTNGGGTKLSTRGLDVTFTFTGNFGPNGTTATAIGMLAVP